MEIPPTAVDSTWPPRRLATAILASLFGLLLVLASSLWVGRWFANDARAEVLRRTEAAAALRNATLTSELEKHRSLPLVLAQDDDVRDALAGHDPAHVQALNRKLEVLRAETRAAAIYVVDHAGMTIAASNWREPSSFVGTNYSFRPYFRDALSSGYAEMFALGTVSQSPGLYLARRVTPGALEDTGVIVVKVSFDALESQWSAAGEPAFVTDARGIVLITSVPAWRFSTLQRLDAAEIARLRQGLQYGSDATLQPLPFAIVDGAAMSTASGPQLPGARQFAAARAVVPATDWTLHVLAPADRATEAARSAGRLLGAFAAALALAGLLLAAILRERSRMRDAAREQLETQVAARTRDLKGANERLVHEMEERRRTEAQMHLLQDELIQANKLALLGQIAAGVAHEINQPVAAIRSFVDNATELLARGSLPTVRDNLAAVVGLTERIGLITEELRSFARKSTGAPTLVDVNKALDGALLMLSARLRSAGVRLDRGASDCVYVLAERVRLEQVVINLLQNAIDALSGHPSPVIRLRVEVDAAQVRLIVADNGPGLPPHVVDALFQPFVSTKPQGLGLGLVISRDIVAEFGGVLELACSGPAGATFVVTLRRQE